MKGEQRPQVKLCNVGFFRRQMSWKLNSFCNSSIELITYFRGIGRPPLLSSVVVTPSGISATLNMKSRLAIKFPTPYEWWSNALPPRQEKTPNARGMPPGGCWSFDLTGTLQVEHFEINNFIIQLHFVEYKQHPQRVQISRGICTPEDRLDRFVCCWRIWICVTHSP